MNSNIFSVDHTGIEPASKKLQISLAMPWYILAHFNENVGNAEIESAATAFARSLARGPRVTLGYIKQNLNHAELGSLETALDLEAANHIRCSQTDDHREAAAAFVEKRAPVFKGC